MTLLQTGVLSLSNAALIATLKPQSNRPSYSNTVIGTLAVDGWAVRLHLVQLGGAWAGPQSAQVGCYKCNSPPIN